MVALRAWARDADVMIGIILSCVLANTGRGLPQHMERGPHRGAWGLEAVPPVSLLFLCRLSLVSLRVWTLELSGFESQPCFILIEQVYASHVTSLGLGFQICKLRIKQHLPH